MVELNVASVFEGFCKNLRFSSSDKDTISKRYHSITKKVNDHYRGYGSDSDYCLYVGSYGRDTEISTSDIDMIVELPPSLYHKYKAYQSNGPSALLQDVKNTIKETYSQSDIKADGQIIGIKFSDGINFEVLPAFLNTNGKTYTFANSNNGGSWNVTDPRSEIDAVNNRDRECNGNLKELCKMARAWRDQNTVDISGILIDILAYRFISDWTYKDKSYFYYDFMTRDFLKYVSEVPKDQIRWQVMGSDRYIYDFGSFQNKAKEAYEKSLVAIEDSIKGYSWSANKKWVEIYGKKFPDT